MRLTAEMALRGVAATLRERIAPGLTDDFAREATRLAELVVTIVANGIDDAAEIRFQENARIRTLFARAASLALPDPELATSLGEAAGSTDPGLRISQLDAENGRLRTLLVRLHSAVEDQPGDAASAMDREIWQLLRETEAARAPRS